MDIVEIYDPIGKKKRKVKNLEKVLHEIPDKEDGKVHSVPVVEFTVVGNNHEWPLWLFYDAFKEANPDIEI